ncbi:hypothetical protein LB456_09015 [Psychroflexus sp. CAK57W]|uniref:hypothetical protein n=1 Tax=Psychroflexus curvus TaxID=2873595 RepID=UPI001CCDD859|nr:hypothetical protein [Psychroflexus curvus]MBZ9787594.1 hypothetical protein [Psychroflexus curvus]
MEPSRKAMNEFLQLGKDKLYIIAMTEWWLLKHSDLYNKLAIDHRFIVGERFSNTYLRTEVNKYPNNVRFLEIYDCLDKISKYQRREGFFKNELDIYHKIQHNLTELNLWMKKHYKMWDKSYVLFIVENLYHGNLDLRENHIKQTIHLPETKFYKFFIDKSDFKSTIEFLFIFEDHFYFNNLIENKFVEGKQDDIYTNY